MTDILTTAEVLWGNLKVDPVPYTLIAEKSGPWWWRKTVYKIRSTYMTIGPYTDRNDAMQALLLLQREPS